MDEVLNMKSLRDSSPCLPNLRLYNDVWVCYEGSFEDVTYNECMCNDVVVGLGDTIDEAYEDWLYLKIINDHGIYFNDGDFPIVDKVQVLTLSALIGAAVFTCILMMVIFTI